MNIALTSFDFKFDICFECTPKSKVMILLKMRIGHLSGWIRLEILRKTHFSGHSLDIYSSGNKLFSTFLFFGEPCCMVEFTKTRPVFSMKFQVSKVIPYVFNGFYILFEYISTGRNRFYCIYVTLTYVFLLVKSC